MKIPFPFFFLFLILLAGSALAVGLGVNPAYLDFNVLSESDLEREIYVINSEEKTFDFSLYSDSDAVNANPNKFSLKSGENKKVLIRLDPKKFNENFKATLFIVSSEPSETDVRAGIKMPINVKVLNQETLKKTVKIIDAENTIKEEPGEGINPTGLFSLAGQTEFWGILAIALIAIAAFVLFKRKQKN